MEQAVYVKQLRSRNISISSATNETVCKMGEVDDNEYTNNDIMRVLMSNKCNLERIEADIATIKTDITEVKRDHKALEERVTVVEHDMADVKASVTRLQKVETDFNILKDAYNRSQISAVKQTFNSMQYNIIVRNYPEFIAQNATTETHAKSMEHAIEIINNVFDVGTDVNIPIATAHRLPSTKAGPKPLIFKLVKLSDKQKLWDNIANIKKYNARLSYDRKVSIQMIQLPEKLANDKNSLQADFNTARSNGLNPKWHYMKRSGVYCYKVGNTTFKPKVNHFMNKYIRDSDNH